MLRLAVSPEGRLVEALGAGAGDGLDGDAERRVRTALDRGNGELLLHLALGEPAGVVLPPAFEWFRSLARLFITRLAAIPELEALRGRAVVPPPKDELDAWQRSAPTFPGAEYVDAARTIAFWEALHTAFRAQMATHTGSVQTWLESQHAGVHLAGRVVFHLAENKRDPERPFAFLATFATAGAQKRTTHRPLGMAVAESATAKDRNALLTLLAPVQRAAAASALVRGLVESGALYQPLAWTAAEAHEFLRDTATFEAAGVVVRVPDWWRGRRTLAPVVRVRLGEAPPSGIGGEGLLDFRIDVALEEEPLSEAELRALLAGTETLLFLRGHWVEVDRERLVKVLGHWHDVERVAQAGVSFHEALRLIAGAAMPARTVADPADDPERRWTRVEPGPWLQAALARLRDPASDALEPGPGFRAELRPYQKAGLRWLATLRTLGLGGCLADDMGLGKTVQVIGLLCLIARESRNKDSRTSLLVVPASLLGNWQRELARFAPELRVLLAHPSQAATPDEPATWTPTRFATHDVVVTTYQYVLRVPAFAQVTWEVVALDEAQAIKNPGAKQTRAVKQLPARTRVALTGTPVENRLGDLWSLFDFVAPGLLGSAREFAEFTKRLAKEPTEGYAALRTLVRPYILRRLKTDKTVIADLPEKVELTVYCPLSRRQAALYEQTVRALAKTLAERRADREDASGNGVERRGLVLSTLLRLKQICNHPAQWLKETGAWSAADSGKLARLSPLIDEIASRQEKLLVFTQFREIAPALAGFLAEGFGRPGLVLTGSTAVNRRKRLVDEFQDPAGPPFFVISLKAGGTGLNLTAASHVVHFDRWWNPAVENQATDRAFRIGQTRQVVVHKLVCRGTVEERIDDMLAGKRALAAQVLAPPDGQEVSLTELPDAELLRTLALDLKQAVTEV